MPSILQSLIMIELWLALAVLALACIVYGAWRRRHRVSRLDVGVVSQQWLVSHRAEER